MLKHMPRISKQTVVLTIDSSYSRTPWQEVGTDLFSLRNKDCNIMADYTSKFFDIFQLEGIEAPTVVFSKLGIPKEVISDYGPQYVSRQFACEWDFKHDSSSPEYPQSNCFIEKPLRQLRRPSRKHSIVVMIRT